MYSLKRFLFVIIIFHIYGCGQMGPLYLPDNDTLSLDM